MVHATSSDDELFAAICHNEADTVLKLLAAGGDVNKCCANGLTPLMVAARAGADDALATLLQAGAEVNATDAHGRDALNWLCRSGLTSHYHTERHVRPALLLIRAGALPFREDVDGDSAFWLSIRHGLEGVLRLIHLLHLPLPLEARHRCGDTPLLHAARHAYASDRCFTNRVLWPLLRLGSDTHATDTAGRKFNELYPYYRYESRTDWYEPGWQPDMPVPVSRKRAELQTAVCAPHARDSRGCTPLHHAARQGHYEAADTLLRHGADIEATTPSGATPLMLAARCGRWRVGALLLAHGADMHRQDRHGNCALNMARAAGNYRLYGMMTGGNITAR